MNNNHKIESKEVIKKLAFRFDNWGFLTDEGKNCVFDEWAKNDKVNQILNYEKLGFTHQEIRLVIISLKEEEKNSQLPYHDPFGVFSMIFVLNSVESRLKEQGIETKNFPQQFEEIVGSFKKLEDAIVEAEIKAGDQYFKEKLNNSEKNK